MKTLIYDIETFKSLFALVIMNEKEEVGVFEISERKNEIYKICKILDEESETYWVGYNNLNFDAPILEYIYNNHENWINLNGKEICEKIHELSQKIINGERIKPEFKTKQIDLMKIWHFDNKNRRTGLKHLEFSMNFERIVDLPFKHDSELTEAQMDEIIEYCKHDIKATYKLYRITRGLEEKYKGEDKIKDRIEISNLIGIDCMNMSDVQIGSEWNKIDYIKDKEIDATKLYPTKVIHYYGKKFGEFIPKNVSFENKNLKELVRTISNTFALNKKQEFKFKFNNELTVTIAKGGIHSNEKERFIVPSSDEYYYQVDISSQYPTCIVRHKIEPAHLPGWSKVLENKIANRIVFKKLYKETSEPKYNSFQKLAKYALNGGSFGRLNTETDWQYYPYGMLKVTITCQMEILSLVEKLINRGFRVVSVNTDGFDVIIKKERDEEFKAFVNSFDYGEFEFTRFLWIAQMNVNNYIAKDESGKIKEKGIFRVDKELHENNSFRIIPLALRAYFVDNIHPEDFIKNHKNIHDFTAFKKKNKDFYYKIGEKTYEGNFRYIMTKEGDALIRVKKEGSESKAPKYTMLEFKANCRECNDLHGFERSDINFDFYIDRTVEIIEPIIKKKVKKTNQLELFL